MTIGTGPTGVIVDPSTDTIYVATVATDLSGAVWVIDGASCNATTTSGCRRRPPSVKVGNGANLSNTAMAVDQDNDTIYVDNYTDNTVSMIDTASCNAAVTTGCAQTPKTAPTGVGPNPDGLGLDAAAHTVYVASIPTNIVSLLDTSTCNAMTTSGCGALRSESLRAGRLPGGAMTVDQGTGTLYVPNATSNNVSVFNVATCNATLHAGCADGH